MGEAEHIICDKNFHSEYAHIDPNTNIDIWGGKIPARGLTELDRLRYTVSSIDKGCSIVPQGSYKKNTLGEVKRNEAFNGLKLNQNFDLSNYSILQKVEDLDKID